MWPGGGGESGARSCRAEGEDGTSRPEGASLGPSSQDPTHGVRHCGCRPEWPRVCRAGRPGHVPATPCCLCALVLALHQLCSCPFSTGPAGSEFTTPRPSKSADKER